VDVTQATVGKAGRHWAAALTAIVLIAALPRVGLVYYANRQSTLARQQGKPDPFLWPDSERYLQAAANVAAGRGPMVSPTNRTGVDPGYPLLLSWPMRIWPDDVQKVAAAARWMNVPAGLATVVFVAYLGRLLFGALAGLVAAAILAVQPIQIYFHALVLTEVIYTTLLAGSLYALARYMLGGGGANLFVCAIGLGLGMLLRSSGLLLPVLLLPLVFYAGWRSPRGPGRTSGAAAAVVTFCVCYACVLIPASYRNYRILGEFVPVRTGMGESLLEAVGPWATGGPGMEKIQRPAYPEGANEYVRDQLDRDAAIRYIERDPGRFLRLAGIKFLRTWNVRMNLAGFRKPLYDVLAMISTIPVYVLAIVGWVRHRRQVSGWYLLLVPAVYITLLHMVFVGSVRYRYPAMPEIMVLAGAAVVAAPPLRGKKVESGGE
jgi:4-amino-4-deoxy-L-arabinose transferase-like glycosyltransferase